MILRRLPKRAGPEPTIEIFYRRDPMKGHCHSDLVHHMLPAEAGGDMTSGRARSRRGGLGVGLASCLLCLGQ